MEVVVDTAIFLMGFFGRQRGGFSSEYAGFGTDEESLPTSGNERA